MKENNVLHSRLDADVMRRDDMHGYKINKRRFNVDDGAYLDRVEFSFKRMNGWFYCFMDDFTSKVKAHDTNEVRDELVWANVKCWLKSKYGKNYYKEYERNDLGV